MAVSPEMQAWNRSVVEEFRAHGGRVRDPGFPVLLLTTTGRSSGRPRTTPLGYAVDAGRVLVVGSAGGADEDPAWFLDLVAEPRVGVEIGTRSVAATARVTDGAEREALLASATRQNPGYGHYRGTTDRAFPVVVLEGVDPPAGA